MNINVKYRFLCFSQSCHRYLVFHTSFTSLAVIGRGQEYTHGPGSLAHWLPSEISISDFGILTSKRDHHHDSLISCHNVQEHRRPPPLNRQSGCGIVEGRTVCRWTTLLVEDLPACMPVYDSPFGNHLTI